MTDLEVKKKKGRKPLGAAHGSGSEGMRRKPNRQKVEKAKKSGASQARFSRNSKKNRRQRPISKKSKSTRNELWAGLILAIGLGLLCSILYLGYQRYDVFGFSNTQMSFGKNAEAVFQRRLQNQGVDNSPGQDQHYKAPKLKKAGLSDFEGQWETRSDDKYGFYGFQDGHYQMLFVPYTNSQRRLFSNGSYEYDDEIGVLMLRPDFDFKPPQNMPSLEFKALTYRKYKIFMIKDAANNRLIWKPYVVKGLPDQKHPLFGLMNKRNSYLIWEPLR